MKIFIDSADLTEIRDAAEMGLVDGVTTNPSLIAKTGRPLKDVIVDICEIVDGPISAEVLAVDYEGIVREGHEAINRAGAEKGLTPRSTCALLFVRNSQAYWAHVGDSRIYRLRDSHLTRLTRDHSVVQMLVDLGKVSEEEMGTHPDQNRLTQSLGGEAAPMPDFGSDGVQPHDAFLICSDGLWEMIPQPEMVSALAAKKLGELS